MLDAVLSPEFALQRETDLAGDPLETSVERGGRIEAALGGQEWWILAGMLLTASVLGLSLTLLG